jgi:site-specific DNA-methyltransferase (adenine-specific)
MDLRNGDCLELMKTLPDKSVDLFICDLPYGETNCKWDSVIDLDEFWIQFKRIRKSKRTACIHFCSTKFGYNIIKTWEKGFKMDMVWKKRNKTGGLQSKHRPMRNHEMVYFFYEQAPMYNRDKYHKRIAQKKHGIKKEGEITYGLSSKMGPINNFEPPNPGSIFISDKVFIGKKRYHQTEKPLDILEFFLKYYSNEDDTILDPTMGSGSTGCACKKLKRKFIGFELDPKIFKVAKERIDGTEDK